MEPNMNEQEKRERLDALLKSNQELAQQVANAEAAINKLSGSNVETPPGPTGENNAEPETEVEKPTMRERAGAFIDGRKKWAKEKWENLMKREPETPFDTKKAIEEINEQIKEEIFPSEVEKKQRIFELFLEAKEKFNKETIETSTGMSAKAKRALVATEKYWEEANKNKAFKFMKVGIGAACMGGATMLGAGVAGVHLSTLNTFFKLGTRVIAATGLNMAMTYGVVEKTIKTERAQKIISSVKTGVGNVKNEFSKKKEGKIDETEGEETDEIKEKNFKEKTKEFIKEQANLKNALMLGGLGLSFILSGGVVIPGIALAGIGLRELTDYIKKNTTEKLENKIKSLSEKIGESNDGYNVEDFAKNLDKLGKEREKILKQIKWVGKTASVIKGALTIGTGIATMAAFDHSPNGSETEKNPSGVIAEETHSPKTTPVETTPTKTPEVVPPTAEVVNPAETAPAAAGTNAEVTVTSEVVKFENEGIKFEHGKGGIQGILDLKKQIAGQYNNGDYSSAPKSVQDFMNTDATKQAMRLGLFDPEDKSGKESALIQEGSMLKFDKDGNLLFGKPDTNGNIPILEKYEGKMFDSDKSGEAPKTETVVEPADNTAEENTKNITTNETPTEPSPAENVSEPEKVIPPTAEDLKARIEAQMDASENDLDSADENTNDKQLSDTLREKGYTGDPTVKKDVDEFFQKLKDDSVVNQSNLEKGLTIHPEFIDNPFKLDSKTLMEVIKLHEHNVEHIFENEEKWEDFSDFKAKDWVHETGVGEDSSSELIYLNKLTTITGLKPMEGWAFFDVGAETNGEYIARALQKAAEMGKLEQLKIE